MEEKMAAAAGALPPGEKERLETLQAIVQIHINGDWDDRMIETAFDSLENAFYGSSSEEKEEKPPASGRGGRGRSSRRRRSRG